MIWLVISYLHCYFCGFILIFKGLGIENTNTMKNRKGDRESQIMHICATYWNQRELQVVALPVTLAYCSYNEA